MATITLKQIQRLLTDSGYPLGSVDGIMGRKTKAAANRYCHDILHRAVAGDVVSDAEFLSQLKRDSRILRPHHILVTAKQLGVEPATLKAIVDVETSGSGYQGLNLKCLFEPHIFKRLLVKDGYDANSLVACNKKDSDLLRDRWSKHNPTYRLNQVSVVQRAVDMLDRAGIPVDYAYQAASWGLPQVMGYHHDMLGFDSAASMMKSMLQGPQAQLNIMGTFIKKADHRLLGAVKARNWALVARIYNGRGNVADYSRRLARAYNRNNREV